MANYNTVITNEGAALLASVIANHGTITFTNLKLSENDYTGQEATLTEGTFDGIFANVSVASSIVDITTIKVSATVHGYNFSGDHNLYALGVIGTDGNTTALIAICTTTNPDVLRDNSSTYAFNINLTVSSTSNITVVGTTAAALYTTDIVDNLTSAATDKPLSANMGRVLGEELSHRNLVDNGWFTVNQRGAASYATIYEYSADRWKILTNDTTVAISSNGITLSRSSVGTASLRQILENTFIHGKTVTASVLLQNGTVLSGTGVFPTTSGTTIDLNLSTDVGIRLGISGSNETYYQLQSLTGNSINVRAVKLEVGSVSTLHLDVAPDYTTELLKCQRYFLCVEGLTNGAILGLGTPNSATTMYAAVPLPTPMRATPTLSYTGTGHILQGGSTMALTNITIDTISNVYAQIIVVSSGLTIGQVGILRASSGGLKIFLSADL